MIKRDRNQFFPELLKIILLPTVSPEKKALSITIGFYLGIFPITGLTTLLCMAVIFLFRFNALLTITINLMVTPLQILLALPFLKAGRILFFNDNHILPDIAFKDYFSENGYDAICYLLESITGGIAIWGILSIGSGFFLYKIILRITKLIRPNSISAEF